MCFISLSNRRQSSTDSFALSVVNNAHKLSKSTAIPHLPHVLGFRSTASSWNRSPRWKDGFSEKGTSLPSCSCSEPPARLTANCCRLQRSSEHPAALHRGKRKKARFTRGAVRSRLGQGGEKKGKLRKRKWYQSGRKLKRCDSGFD